MRKALIIGAGEGGMAILHMIQDSNLIQLAGVVDKKDERPGIKHAKDLFIPTYRDWTKGIKDLTSQDIVIDVTGDERIYEDLLKKTKEKDLILIPGSVAALLFQLIREKKELIENIRQHSSTMERILQSTSDGMIAIDVQGNVTMMNKQAEVMTGMREDDVLGIHVRDILPTSRLPRVLETGEGEYHQRQTLNKNRKIITTRVPIVDGHTITGALAVFKDVTDIMAMAEEVTNLKSIRTMLEAIIQSSEDAISVVDEQGRGMIINPAYTRITGLTEEQVIGKPATADISEGDSMHLRVLRTREAVRGVRMKLGPQRKDVIVNVAPVLVDDEIKGSVGVVHDVSELEALTSELEKAKKIIRTLEAQYGFKDIAGKSPQLHVAIDQAKLAAVTPATILLRGESGTGKELFAHAIHNESKRRFNKFIRVNCASLSETLLESELFGYEGGAFSGARRGGKKGLFEEADKGSIFLDEIGELSPKMQAKLLRVLQEGELIRVGGTKSIQVDVRVIAATNITIEEKIEEGEFRADLYYRLNRMPITIPPLRERIEDLEILADTIMIKLNQEYGRNVQSMTPDAVRKLTAYDWPGNVRELENVLGRAMIHMPYPATEIDADHLPEFISHTEKTQTVSQVNDETETLEDALKRAERSAIEKALIRSEGVKTRAAQELGISIRSLYYKMEKLNIDHAK